MNKWDFYIELQIFKNYENHYSMNVQANEVFYQGDESNVFEGSYEVIKDVPYFNVYAEEISNLENSSFCRMV